MKPCAKRCGEFEIPTLRVEGKPFIVPRYCLPGLDPNDVPEEITAKDDDRPLRHFNVIKGVTDQDYLLAEITRRAEEFNSRGIDMFVVSGDGDLETVSCVAIYTALR